MRPRQAGGVHQPAVPDKPAIVHNMSVVEDFEAVR
jgi:hypothetical protein